MVRFRIRFQSVGWCILFLVLGSFLTRIGWYEFLDADRLHRSGVVTLADVTDRRTEDLRGPSRDVRYGFRIPGRPEEFTRTDRSFGRENLWVALSAKAWEDSFDTDRIAVRYVPDAPEINGLAEPADKNRMSMLAFTLLGAALGLWGLGMLVVAAFEYRRYKRSPPSAVRECLLFSVSPVWMNRKGAE